MGHDTILALVDHFSIYSYFLLLSLIHILQRMWLHYLFVRLYVSIMVFPNLLCLNEIGFLSDSFCKNCSSCLVLASNWAQLITLNISSNWGCQSLLQDLFTLFCKFTCMKMAKIDSLGWIQWKNLPDIQKILSTPGNPMQSLMRSFLNFPFEDKVKLAGADILRLTISRVYSLKNKGLNKA